MKASYQQKEYLFNNKIEYLEPGQFIAGRKMIKRETGISETTIERILSCFESEHQIGQQKNNKFRIITILNWNEYQVDGQQNGHQMDNKWTSSGHLVDTINKEKKEKKEKNILISNFILPEKIKKEIWEAYLEMRKSIKKPATLFAQKLIITKILKFKGDPNLILQQSIESSWQDVYELKSGGNGNGFKPNQRSFGANRELSREASDMADAINREYETAKAATALRNVLNAGKDH